MKAIAKKTLARFGFGVYRLPSASSPGNDFDVSFLPRVDLVIDVGVAHGTPWLYQQFPASKLLLIDPVGESAELEACLGGRDHTFVQCALGAEAGMATVNVDVDQPSRSSLLERTPLTQTSNKYRTVETQVRRLDDIDEARPKPGETVGLKIDAEGFEMEILRGGVNLLKDCSFVVCEASVSERFYDSYRLEDLVCFMKSHGFGVASVLTADRDPNGVIRFLDIAFVPKRSD